MNNLCLNLCLNLNSFFHRNTKIRKLDYDKDYDKDGKVINI